jgi:AbiV family abortive infection protein
MKKEINRLFKRTDSMMNILSRLPDNEVEIIQNEMLDNAYLLIEDAKLLIKQNNSFGHAFGLIALACEEIAKVNMLFFKRKQESKKDPLRNHIKKQQSLATLTFARYIPIYITETFEREINEEIREDEDALEKIFDENFQDFIQDFTERIQNDSELKKRMLQRQDFFGRLETNEEREEIYKAGFLSEMREYSLYVDVISDTEYFTPKKISKDVALALKHIAEEDLYYTDLFYNKGEVIKKYTIKKPDLPLSQSAYKEAS